MKKLALILGSGFSAAAGLPTTNKVNEKFIAPPARTPGGYHDGLEQTDEDFITAILKQFWRDVFGWVDGQPAPTLEEHFTQLDFAANSGHHLGPKYSPKHLRAIRRFSIHRVFHILDAERRASPEIESVLKMAFSSFATSIVTLNWDIVVELTLQAVNYELMSAGRPQVRPSYEVGEKLLNTDSLRAFSATPTPLTPFPMLRMHGAANWMYCDACRHITADIDAKSALHYRAYLDELDFLLFDDVAKAVGYTADPCRMAASLSPSRRACDGCGNRLAGRLATFSYRKAFSIYQFQVTWKRAFEELRDADAWLFFGYSLPEADYEFKSLLKAAQLARRDPASLHIEATTGPETKPDGTVDSFNVATRERYQKFFGSRATRLVPRYLDGWVADELAAFVARF